MYNVNNVSARLDKPRPAVIQSRLNGGDNMTMTDAKRRANYKYDAKTYTTCAAKIKRSDAAKLQELLRRDGLTVNAFLTRCIMDYIKQAGD